MNMPSARDVTLVSRAHRGRYELPPHHVCEITYDRGQFHVRCYEPGCGYRSERHFLDVAEADKVYHYVDANRLWGVR